MKRKIVFSSSTRTQKFTCFLLASQAFIVEGKGESVDRNLDT